MRFFAPRTLGTALLLVAFMAAAGTPGLSTAQTTPTAQVASDESSSNDESVLNDALVRFQAKKGLGYLYNMKFEKAKTLFDQIDNRYPNHPVGPFLNALNTWWQILINLQSKEHDEAFIAAMNEVIQRSERILERDPDNFDARFFKGAALGFRGRHYSNRKQWWKAARDGKRAMDYVLGVAEENPENDDYVFGKGIYDYYAAVVPERYPFAEPFMVFFPDGSRKRGLRELKRTAEEGFYIQTEAAYFLLQIYYRFEKNFSKSKKYATWLREEHPDNSFFHTYEGRMYARFGRWNQAKSIFEKVWKRYKAGQTGYVDATGRQALYFRARHALIADEHKRAVRLLEKLEALGEGKNSYFKVWGQLRRGMAYDALGRRALALKHYQQALERKEWGEVHERAERYIDSPYGG
jgi:tetratricopeptide (TPR) repeat protein